MRLFGSSLFVLLMESFHFALYAMQTQVGAAAKMHAH